MLKPHAFEGAFVALVTGALMVPLMLMLFLTGCGSDGASKTRQGVYDLESAYHVFAAPMPDILAGKVAGISLTPAQIVMAKNASQTVSNEIDALVSDVQAGKTVTQTALDAVQADMESFVVCWAALKSSPLATCAPKGK